MTPTADSFHALARSSPWRWRTLHFTHRGPLGEVDIHDVDVDLDHQFPD